MTNEEVIKKLKNMIHDDKRVYGDKPKQRNEALDLAIKALEADRWIPVSERLPDDLEPVNITWINHEPAPNYKEIKDKPFTATGLYFNGQWYWWSATCEDILAAFSHNYDDIIDKDIEVTAWKPLPEEYKGENT